MRPIIVGSGPIGLSIACAFAHAGIGVRLIEVGGDHSDLTGGDLLTPIFTGTRLNGATLGRTRQLGGGLNLWGGQLAWPNSSETQIGLNALDSDPALKGYARAALANLGISTMHFGETETAQDILKRHSFIGEFGFEMVSTAWLPKPKLSKRFWEQFKESALIEVIRGLFVDRIEVNGQGSVVGVSGVRYDKTRREEIGGPVIIAAGTIETIRLLFQPKADGTQQSWSNLRWLGRGFNDHLDANVASLKPKNSTIISDIFDPFYRGNVKHTAKLLKISAQGNEKLSAAVMLVAPGNIRNALSELKLLTSTLTPKALPTSAARLIPATLAALKEVGPLAWRYLRHRRLGTVLRGEANLRVLAEQPSRWSSRIALSTERDSLGVRRPSIHWVRGSEEAKLFSETAQALKGLFEGSGIGNVTIDPLLERDPSAFTDSADEGLHHTGGARIGDGASSGVVDTNLQVFGTSGLYCCGASVLPQMGYSNPTLLAMALGNRLVQHLTSCKARVA